MTHIAQLLILIAGIYQVVMSFVTNTEGFIAALIFKVIPFILGCSCIFAYLVWTQIIILNIK